MCSDHPSGWGRRRTMQGIVMGAAQMLTQGFHNCSNLHIMDKITIMTHGLPNGLQASSYGARKIVGTPPDTKSIIKLVKQDGVEKLPNKTSSCVDPNIAILESAAITNLRR